MTSRRCSFLACLALAVAAAVCAQSPARNIQNSKSRAAGAFDKAVKAGPEALRAFLVEFPKGADLHVHLSGAVYAETLLRDAGQDGLCVDPAALSLAQPPCAGGLVPAAQLSGDIAAANQKLYDRLIDSFSMRSFVPSPGWSGHDQFFAAFGHFSGLSPAHAAEWVDEVASRAAAQNEQYLELMETPPFSHAAGIAHEVGWTRELAQADLKAFAALRQQLLDKGLRDEVAAGRAEASRAEAQRKQAENCGTVEAASACAVVVRYIYQVLRGFPPEQVFAQALLGFETVEASVAAKDDTWVGINFVMPEDGFVSMRDYTLQMKMLGFLHSVYPKVHISLHAGELTLGLVPPEGLRSHIREAVKLAHAERIGHGVDAMYETNADALLREMAEGHVMVEVNLSSNEGILGVKGAEHPFPIYFASKVPVALSTDDEGVSRIDLTHEYVRAALDYNLTYDNLKKLARTGLEHAFLPGDSLWAWPDDFAAPVKACQRQTLGGDTSAAECKAFLRGSEKAAAQWELERRLRAFERAF